MKTDDKLKKLYKNKKDLERSASLISCHINAIKHVKGNDDRKKKQVEAICMLLD